MISSVLGAHPSHACLLYTSDAADDLLCVDLGGRRIITKKKHYDEGADDRQDPKSVRNTEYRSPDGDEVHRRRRVLLRGETTRVDDHQSLCDGVRAEGEDHGGYAK